MICGDEGSNLTSNIQKVQKAYEAAPKIKDDVNVTEFRSSSNINDVKYYSKYTDMKPYFYTGNAVHANISWYWRNFGFEGGMLNYMLGQTLQLIPGNQGAKNIASQNDWINFKQIFGVDYLNVMKEAGGIHLNGDRYRVSDETIYKSSHPCYSIRTELINTKTLDLERSMSFIFYCEYENGYLQSIELGGDCTKMLLEVHGLSK